MNKDIPTSYCSSEKYWEERSDSEKILKLAEQLEYLHGIVNSQTEIIQKLENQMFFADGPVSPLGWPNRNILNKEKK